MTSTAVKPFASKGNTRLIEKANKRSTRAFGTTEYSVPANHSVIITIPYEREFSQRPVVLYSLTYKSDHFDVSSHITTCNAKSVSVAIENLDVGTPVDGTIMWEAFTC